LIDRDKRNMSAMLREEEASRGAVQCCEQFEAVEAMQHPLGASARISLFREIAGQFN
jgi:hypothetical protein